ncbi:hypothetical protein NPIL_648911 [Nephila pilipes]|uniref:Uncharacterized protein n=1 Tax=Nephila pilipes TaxID=299642 RepID=A0A8X6TXD9_NEPPI|nr:hypothetical protein NPIL_648911 [Nephila pilipes]
MEDVLSGADSLCVAKELQSELLTVLSSGGITLHKWVSKNAELKTGPDSERRGSAYEEVSDFNDSTSVRPPRNLGSRNN